MSVKYRLYQDNRAKSTHKGCYYARAIVSGSVNTNDLAKNIEKRCTVTLPDILAVMSALETEIATQIQAGNKVVLNGFGSFRIGLATKPATTVKEFNNTHIKGIHIIFHPETKVNASRKHTQPLTEGCKVENLSDFQDNILDKAEAGGDKTKSGDNKASGGNADTSK